MFNIRKLISICISISICIRILLPGGGVWFDDPNGYTEAGVHIYDIAKQMNDNGNYFPLFGICLGFELLLYASNEEREYRTVCSSSKQKNTLNFSKSKHGTPRAYYCMSLK